MQPKVKHNECQLKNLIFLNVNYCKCAYCKDMKKIFDFLRLPFHVFDINKMNKTQLSNKNFKIKLTVILKQPAMMTNQTHVNTMNREYFSKNCIMLSSLHYICRFFKITN
jgi:hypothetical protein